MKTKKIKIYLIARISKNARNWNEKVANGFNKNQFEVFCPHKDNQWDGDEIRHEKISQQIVDVDVQAINDSHFGLALPEFGRDCAWETGYYANSEKPLVFFVDSQTEWLRDWMIKGGLDCVITNNVKTYEILKRDPILRNKNLLLIEKITELNEVFLNLYKKHYDNGKT
jgi:nucleoside 2-deoxyribosyltransferase